MDVFLCVQGVWWTVSVQISTFFIALPSRCRTAGWRWGGTIFPVCPWSRRVTTASHWSSPLAWRWRCAVDGLHCLWWTGAGSASVTLPQMSGRPVLGPAFLTSSSRRAASIFLRLRKHVSLPGIVHGGAVDSTQGRWWADRVQQSITWTEKHAGDPSVGLTGRSGTGRVNHRQAGRQENNAPKSRITQSTIWPWTKIRSLYAGADWQTTGRYGWLGRVV